MDIGSILITASITLLVTVLGGLALEYFKRVKPKLKYSVKESVPIDLDHKKIGANIIEISNPSSKTVKEIVLKLRAKDVDIKNAGVKTVTGLDYEILKRDGSLEIKIPFLKYKDYLSITAILEGEFSIPNKPEITVRSPDNFKLIDEADSNDKVSSPVLAAANILAPLALGGVVAWAFFGSNIMGNSSSKQGVNLSLAAAVVGLPDLAEYYVSNNEVYYYSQGPIVYSKAKSNNDLNEVAKYGDFLEKTLTISPSIASHSKSALQFFIAKIRMLEGKKPLADNWFAESKSTNKEEYTKLVEFFKMEKPNDKK